MKISELADQIRGIPLRDVLEHYGFEVRPEGTALRAKDAHRNIVVKAADGSITRQEWAAVV